MQRFGLLAFDARTWMTSFAILFHLSNAYGVLSKTALVKNYNANDPAFFKQFDELLTKYKPLNFGLGFPDFNPPKILQNALAEAATSDNYQLSQYGPINGHPRLCKAVTNLFSKLTNRTLDPKENVVITVGATEALYAVFQAHTQPGDEWILFEPYFLAFDSIIKAARGVPRYIPLVANKTVGKITSADFKFNKEDLANLFNEKTRGIVLNTPHNPTGKIFDYEEITYIAELARKWDVLVIFDEVYQFMIYDDSEHFRIATFPGMFERTISIGSASKMFSATGYRIGWAYGPKDLMTNIKTVGALIALSVPTPNQEAVAVLMEEEIKNYGKPDSYIEQFRRESIDKRNYFYNILSEAGMTPVFTQSGYFTIANWTTMTDKVELNNKFHEYEDYSFVSWLIKNVKVYAYPMSPAYAEKNRHMGQDYVRFTMIKSHSTLAKLEKLLKEWKSKRKQLACRTTASKSAKLNYMNLGL